MSEDPVDDVTDPIRQATDKVVRLRVAAKDDGDLPPLVPTTFVLREPHLIEPRQWLYGYHLIRSYVSATISPGGLGKSSLVLVEALALATGRALLGDLPHDRLRVWYWSGEDPQDETERRLTAACKYYRITNDDLTGYLMFDTAREQPITLATDDGGRAIVQSRQVERVIDAILSRGIDVVTIDPFISSHGVRENDNGSINDVVRAWAMIAHRTGCAVELVHHVRKPGAGAGGETTVDDARGATALIGAVRSARVLNIMSENDAAAAEVENRLQFFSVTNGKANLAPRSADAIWRRIVSVDLHNERIDRPSDKVGVVIPWAMPSVFAGVTNQAVFAIQERIAEGSYRASPQSADWVGNVVAAQLALDLQDTHARARINQMLKAWFQNGLLRIVETVDASRRKRPHVAVGRMIELN